MKKVLLTLLALTSIFRMVNAVMPGPYTCPQTMTPPVIDGDYSDWGSMWLDLDSIVGSTRGCTARFQMEFDADNLYFVFDIKDSTMGDTSSTFPTWAMDCVEVDISMDTTTSNSSTPGGIRTGMYEFRHVEGRPEKLTDGISWGNDIPIVSDPALQIWNAIANFKLKEQDDSDGYVQEWQLPWDSLTKNMDTTHMPKIVGGDTTMVLQPWNKQNFKLDVQVSDNTGTAGRTEQLFWAGTSNNSWNNSAYQRVVLLQFSCKKNTFLNGATSQFGLLCDDVHSPEIKNDLQIFANSEKLQISREVKTIDIYNVTGQLVLLAQNTREVNISNLGNGLYIARMEGKSYKFIKQ